MAYEQSQNFLLQIYDCKESPPRLRGMTVSPKESIYTMKISKHVLQIVYPSCNLSQITLIKTITFFLIACSVFCPCVGFREEKRTWKYISKVQAKSSGYVNLTSPTAWHAVYYCTIRYDFISHHLLFILTSKPLYEQLLKKSVYQLILMQLLSGAYRVKVICRLQ